MKIKSKNDVANFLEEVGKNACIGYQANSRFWEEIIIEKNKFSTYCSGYMSSDISPTYMAIEDLPDYIWENRRQINKGYKTGMIFPKGYLD